MNNKLIITASLLMIVLLIFLQLTPIAVGVEAEQKANITDTANTTENGSYVSFLSDDSDVQHNLVCEDLNSNDPQQTPFGELVNTVLYLIVTIGALVSVVLGAGFTMMSAFKPTNDEYVERRNKAIILGGGTIVVVYAVNAMLGEIHNSLDFSCAIPFLGGV